MTSRAVELRSAAWVLLGGLLGTTICLVVVQRPMDLIAVDPVSLASLGVFAMLVRSLHESAGRPLAAAN